MEDKKIATPEIFLSVCCNARIKKHGHTPEFIQRYECTECKRTWQGMYKRKKKIENKNAI